MRTTVEFDDEATRAIEALRRERNLGVSEAVNELIRRGLVDRPATRPFRQRSRRLGLTIDVTSIADALEQLDGPSER